MASIGMVQIDTSWIFSLATPSSSSDSKLSSLNATLNSPAEGPVPSSAQARTIKDLNELNEKLTDVQLSSDNESEDGKPAEGFDPETHSCGVDVASRNQLGFDKGGWWHIWEAAIPYEPHRNDAATVSGLPLLQRGVPILLEIPLDRDALFRPIRNTSSDDANQTPSTTVDGKTCGSRDDEADKDLPAFQRNEWDPMCGKPTDLARYMHYDTSNNAAPMKIKSRL